MVKENQSIITVQIKIKVQINLCRHVDIMPLVSYGSLVNFRR